MNSIQPHIMTKRWLMLTTLFLLPLPLHASEPVSVTGTARSMEGDLLYKEYHRLRFNQYNVDYQKPDGQWLAHKQISYDVTEGIVSFELHYPGTDRLEVVTAEKGEVTVDIRVGEKEIEHQLQYRPGDVIDAGFDPFIRSSWDDITAGKSVNIRFLLFRRGSWINMTVKPIDNKRCLKQYQTDITRCLSVRPESLFLRLLIPELLLGYNDQKRLLLYVGPSGLKLGKRKPSNLVVTYQYLKRNKS